MSNAVESKLELTDEEAERLIRWMKVSQRLRTMSNLEIAKLLIDHVWADVPLGTAKSELIDEAISRLAPELDRDKPTAAAIDALDDVTAREYTDNDETATERNNA